MPFRKMTNLRVHRRGFVPSINSVVAFSTLQASDDQSRGTKSSTPANRLLSSTLVDSQSTSWEDVATIDLEPPNRVKKRVTFALPDKVGSVDDTSDGSHSAGNHLEIPPSRELPSSRELRSSNIRVGHSSPTTVVTAISPPASHISSLSHDRRHPAEEDTRLTQRDELSDGSRLQCTLDNSTSEGEHNLSASVKSALRRNSYSTISTPILRKLVNLFAGKRTDPGVYTGQRQLSQSSASATGSVILALKPWLAHEVPPASLPKPTNSFRPSSDPEEEHHLTMQSYKESVPLQNNKFPDDRQHRRRIRELATNPKAWMYPSTCKEHPGHPAYIRIDKAREGRFHGTYWVHPDLFRPKIVIRGGFSGPEALPSSGPRDFGSESRLLDRDGENWPVFHEQIPWGSKTWQRWFYPPGWREYLENLCQGMHNHEQHQFSIRDDQDNEDLYEDPPSSPGISQKVDKGKAPVWNSYQPYLNGTQEYSNPAYPPTPALTLESCSHKEENALSTAGPLPAPIPETHIQADAEAAPPSPPLTDSSSNSQAIIDSDSDLPSPQFLSAAQHRHDPRISLLSAMLSRQDPATAYVPPPRPPRDGLMPNCWIPANEDYPPGPTVRYEGHWFWPYTELTVQQAVLNHHQPLRMPRDIVQFTGALPRM